MTPPRLIRTMSACTRNGATKLALPSAVVMPSPLPSPREPLSSIPGKHHKSPTLPRCSVHSCPAIELQPLPRPSYRGARSPPSITMIVDTRRAHSRRTRPCTCTLCCAVELQHAVAQAPAPCRRRRHGRDHKLSITPECPVHSQQAQGFSFSEPLAVQCHTQTTATVQLAMREGTTLALACASSGISLIPTSAHAHGRTPAPEVPHLPRPRLHHYSPARA